MIYPNPGSSESNIKFKSRDDNYINGAAHAAKDGWENTSVT